MPVVKQESEYKKKTLKLLGQFFVNLLINEPTMLNNFNMMLNEKDCLLININHLIYTYNTEIY